MRPTGLVGSAPRVQAASAVSLTPPKLRWRRWMPCCGEGGLAVEREEGGEGGHHPVLEAEREDLAAHGLDAAGVAEQALDEGVGPQARDDLVEHAAVADQRVLLLEAAAGEATATVIESGRSWCVRASTTISCPRESLPPVEMNRSSRPSPSSTSRSVIVGVLSAPESSSARTTACSGRRRAATRRRRRARGGRASRRRPRRRRRR
jgi:hypothetical protein